MEEPNMTFKIIESTPTTLSVHIKDVDVSIVNGLRRCILADVSHVAPNFNPYHPDDNDIQILKNTTSLHNEFMGHRISLIPIMLDKQAVLQYTPEDYTFELNVINKTNDAIWVTTKDIIVHDRNGRKLSDEDRDAMFPKNSITHDWIIITKLKPNLKDPQNGQHFHAQWRARLGTARQHARWSCVSMCSFVNYIDDALAKTTYEQMLADIKQEKGRELYEQEMRVFQNQFDCIHKKRCFCMNERGEASEFIFNIETECKLKPIDVFELGFVQLKQKLNKVMNGDFEHLKSNDIDMIHVEDEDHTLGYLFQSYVYNMYACKSEKCEYVGYYMPHPLENRIVVKMKLQNGVECISFVKEAATRLYTMLNELIQSIPKI
jgi:DNA-directed RNA polymerase subunit L